MYWKSVEKGFNPEFIKLSAKINLDNVDGLFVSCTALKIVDILDEVEKKFNTTVISSNQAIIWDCLQLLDMNVNIPGYGKLFNS